LIIENG